MFKRFLAFLKKLFYYKKVNVTQNGPWTQLEMEMPKKKEEPKVEEKVVEPVKTPEAPPMEFKNVAIGYAKNKATGRWQVYEVFFNLETLTVDKVQVAEQSQERLDVEHRFRVLAGTHFYGEI